jgi:hypothetical protein
VLTKLAGNTVVVGRVDMDPPPDAITEKELQQALMRYTDMVKLVKVVQTGLGLGVAQEPLHTGGAGAELHQGYVGAGDTCVGAQGAAVQSCRTGT